VKYRTFGSTGMLISEIGFGCARLGGIFQTGPRSATIRTIRAAHESGITFFDTSDLYSQGESEELLGEALAERRHDVVIASKVGYVLPTRRRLLAGLKPLVRPVIRALGLKRGALAIAAGGRLQQDFSPGHIVRAVEDSLRRLRTDYLDLYQLHSPPEAVLRSGEFLEPLEMLKRQGKIRFYGVSCETTVDGKICLRYPEISSVQLRASVIAQAALAEVVPDAACKGVAVIARECLGGGLLANETAAAIAARGDELLARRLSAHTAAARESGRTLAESALHFVLATPGVSSALLGMRSEEQLLSNLRDLRRPPLTEAEFTSLRAIAA
jgi:aryl-alcohol dehydrogenase-like predicted oxidoreductase